MKIWRSQLIAKQPFTKSIGSYQKYILYTKTKKNPQWDYRMGKINEIILPGGWPTNWKIVISQKLSHRIIGKKRCYSRRTCTNLLLCQLQNLNLLLNNHQQENAESYHKKIPHIQGQRISSNKMEGEKKKSHLQSNFTPTKDAGRGQTKPCAQKDSEAPQRLSQICFECLSVSCRGTGQQWQPWGQGLCLQQTWAT